MRARGTNGNPTGKKKEKKKPTPTQTPGVFLARFMWRFGRLRGRLPLGDKRLGRKGGRGGRRK